MNIKIDEVHNQTIFDTQPDDFEGGGAKLSVVGARYQEADAARIDDAAGQEGLNRADYVRRAIKLKMRYPGNDYFKLMAHFEKVKELLDSLEMPYSDF